MSTNLIRLLTNKFILKVKNFETCPKRLKSTYKAAVLRVADKPLIIEEQKVKHLDETQVRVKVHYCSVNTFDVQSFRNPNLKLPIIPGYELSGEVLEVGPSVKKTSVQVGDRVAVLSKLQGGFAEQCVVDVGDVWRLPSKVKLIAGAVLIYGHTKAIYGFSHLTKLNEKSTIIISTGPAGLGLAAVDVAANVFKVKCFGVCDAEDRGQLVRERGAFRTALFNSKDILNDLGLNKGVDVVYDAVGGKIHKSLNTCCANEGHIFYAAPFNDLTIPAPPFNTKFTIVNFETLRTINHDYYRQLVQDTLDLADQYIIKGHISATFTLKGVNHGIEFIRDKKCTGKVVISMVD